MTLLPVAEIHDAPDGRRYVFPPNLSFLTRVETHTQKTATSSFAAHM